MGQQPGTSTLRKVRTFADDMRRAQEGTSHDVNTLTTATSVVAPTVLARSIDSAAPSLLSKKPAGGFLSSAAGDLMDISNLEQGHEEATIVSERKVKDWSFSNAIVDALQTWWRDTVTEIKADMVTAAPKQLPSHALPERSARIVRAAPLVAQEVPPLPTPPAPSPDTTPRWSHTTPEPQDPAPKVARPLLQPLAPRSGETVPEPSVTPPPQLTTPPPLRSYVSAALPSIRPLPASERMREATPPPPIDATLVAREAAIKEESAKFAMQARAAALRRKEYAALQSESTGNASRYFVYATLSTIAISLVVIIGTAGYAFIYRDGPVAPAPKPGLSMLFAVSESVGVPLRSDRSRFMVELATRVQETAGAPGSFVRFFFYYENDAEETEVPTQAFLDTLDLRAPGSMLRTILGTSMFGVYTEAQNAPFLVLKVRNFEDALGGMLLFEKNMNSDLAPVFGENLERIGALGVFRDEIIGGIDARTLYDQSGNALLMYAFIDRETVVITTSYTALGALAQVLK